ncbi:TetR/AcrR family transcriptional regulator [Nocardia terpenica]|uniref:TetR/AcrR family transcriptional regulator n=1 Tax=Nocardia terpenica TaxID=455432 RepID=UPI0018943519|nr:TetR/AcrR family transcriptional regulator [Nocardia terpenica]MBF6064662.1 TetR/AcrR family transcriptional regulator [Nocardia terpenica]MBF6107178.1 TetR/AcrR family transcriptional regulator [Nocardia terpenica]MBF6114936.1 TetR/AcrR family transcriptional regulator [Nocardia terpenica]MBF6122041.1 TetR/AcrR family transcriptional regulator [Nocardia terpenica]MBF6154424.1 TetR/AcrR family transcriptional regulator [Nocardia terpenica]
MVTSAEQGRETRERLMDAAVALIAEHGWGAVTTRMVAERAGLRPGLVHYHFASVNDLLIDASLRMARGLGAGVLDGALALSGPAGIAELLGALTTYTETDPDTRVFSEMLLAATRYERLRDGLGAVLDEFRAAVAAWLRVEGAVPDLEATAVVLVAALDGLILHRLIDPRLGELGVDGPLRRLTGISDDGGGTGGEPE